MTTATAKEYAWAQGSGLGGIDAQAAGEELDRIREGHEGVLRPSDVVDESRPSEAPLHPAFTWDDKVAAENWRCEEARGVIRSVRVVRQDGEDEEPRKVIAYVHVPQQERQQCYRPTEEVFSDEAMKDAVLAFALHQLEGFKNRYGQLQELTGVFAAIDQVSAARKTKPKKGKAKKGA